MAKVKNSVEDLARSAAKRLDEARAAGQQLTFLPDEAGAPPVDTIERKAGRPKGATNKGSNQMRDYLAARGLRMPEQVLAEMAGLATHDDALTSAMVNAERVLSWAYADAKDAEGEALLPTPGQRVAMFAQLYTAQLRASDALMPYGAAKASPDVSVQQNVQVVLPSAPAADPASIARDVTPRVASRMVPADVAHEIEQKQRVSETESENSEIQIRTDEASH